MGILNRASDGLPSVLVILVRALRQMGPLERERLEALVAPPTLQQVSTTFDDGRMVRQTLNRWLQNGLFEESNGTVKMAPGFEEGACEGLQGLRELGRQLRTLVLSPLNNEDLLATEPGQAADFTHALCWMLAQDPFRLTTGGYKDLINRMENSQFPAEPWAFRNDTRWAGFVDWAPLLGFGWSSRTPRAGSFIMDPTPAVQDSLATVFGSADELPIEDFCRQLAVALPIMDGGDYRIRVEGRLVENSWRPTKDHEISPCFSLSLVRLHESGHLALESRSDAPSRNLLGAGFEKLRSVSHLRLKRSA